MVSESNVPGIAIVGLAVRLPGATTPEQFWRNVRRLEEHIGPPPVGRPGALRPDCRGGFLADVERFDHEAFGIDPREAAAMDPQQRLMLALGEELIGRCPWRGQSVGVFVGASQHAYQQTLLAASASLPRGALAGNLLSLVAARLAHRFDLRGPALTVDSACASTLVALHLATSALAAGDCRRAFVGGINLNLEPHVFELFDRARVLSPTGRCRPYSDEADGMVLGEAAVLLALTRLDDALAEELPIYGVYVGSATGSDGKALGLMTPDPNGQRVVMERALARADVAPEQVSFVETHGTGTPLGDRAEARVLDTVYPQAPRRGAVKQYVGHALAAAGGVGLVRLLGELQPGQIGAVSAFGFGGSNAHAVVMGRPEGTPAPAAVDRPTQRGRRHWLGDTDHRDWLHVPTADGLAPCPGGTPRLRPGGRYLVVGATGGLGGALSRHLATRYGAELVLVGRRPEADRLLADLRDRGARAVYHALDLTDDAARRAALADLRDAGPFDGAFHLAGASSAQAAWSLKRDAWQALRALPCGFWCLFTSIAGVLPGWDRGLEGYAAASRWQWDVAGDEVLAIAWPPWSELGMARDHVERFEARGMRAITPALGLRCLEGALDSGHSRVLVCHPESLAARPPDRSVATTPQDRRPIADPTDRTVLRDALFEMVAAAVGSAPDELRDDLPLAGLGIDSLAALDLATDLEARTGRRLPATLFYESRTLRDVLDRVAGSAPGPPLSPHQRALLALSHGTGSACNLLIACDLDDPARLDLRGAWATTVASHPQLAVGFRESAEGYVPQPAVPTFAQLPRLDVDALVNTPLPCGGPLLRAFASGRRVALCAHHALLDARGLSEVLRVWLLTAAGEALERPPRGMASPPARPSARSLAYWRRTLHAVPPLHLDWAAPVDARSTAGVAVETLWFDADETAAIRAEARRAGTTLGSHLLASYIRALADESGQDDVLVRVAHTPRSALRAVGSHADALPVRVRVDGPGDPLPRRVASALRAALAHADAPLSTLGELALPAHAGEAGATPAAFSYIGRWHGPESPRLGHLEPVVRLASPLTRLTLLCGLHGDRLALQLHYGRTQVEQPLARRLLVGVRQVLRGARRVVVSPSRREGLAHLIARQCERRPEAVAVGGSTYADVAARSGAIARQVGAGRRVGVLAAPGRDGALALLGVMRAGSTYVPLDPRWPGSRIDAVAAAADLDLVLTTEGSVELSAVVEPVTTEVDTSAAWAAPADIAYVMYTSGSSGVPKGVVVGQEAVLAFLDWVVRAFGVRHSDRFVQTGSFGYGGSVRQVFAPLITGGSVWPVPGCILADPEQLLDRIEAERITIWNSVPSLWQHVLAAAASRPEALRSLRWVLVGGEAVAADLVRRWRRLFPQRPRLANLYGSTETVVNATWYEVVRDPVGDWTPIGWPRSHVDVRLEDEHIVVGGAIARGYRDAGLPGFVAGAFHTGDLARRNDEGALVHLGRRDSQVQIRGHRVELAEIEGALSAHQSVRAAAVLYDGRELIAHVEGDAMRLDVLRAWLAGRLPDHMLPHRVRWHGELPRNVAGKVDRRALGAEAFDADARDGARCAAPSARAATRPEAFDAEVAGIWRAVLGMERPARADDHFFQQGGDSIRALEMLAAVAEHTGRRPRPADLRRTPRLGDFVGHLRTLPEPSLEPSRESSPEGDGLPLTEAQRGFFAADAAGRPQLMRLELPLRGRLDLPRLQAALDEVVRRQPNLRSKFQRGSSGLERSAVGELRVPIEPLAAGTPWAEDWAPDLATPPLLRVGLRRLGADHHALRIVAHHIVSDVQGLFTALAETCALHDGVALPPPGELRAPAEPVVDPWWRRQLEGYRPPPLDAGPVRDASWTVDARRFAALRERARRAGSTPFALLLSAWVQTLRAFCEQDDLVVSIANLGSDDPEGVTAAARALPVRVRGSADVADVERLLTEVLAHGDAGAVSIAAAHGSAAPAVLGRLFFTWLDPAGVAWPATELSVDWTRLEARFDQGADDAWVMLSARVGEELRLQLRGSVAVERLATELDGVLRVLGAPPTSALLAYSPPGTPQPPSGVVDRVLTPHGASELLALPFSADDLPPADRLRDAIAAALADTDAAVTALAGMLPAHLDLGREGFGTQRTVTTGHGATVVAMVLTVDKLLEVLGRPWSELSVCAVGYGSIGKSVMDLLRARRGEPGAFGVVDPRWRDAAGPPPQDCDLVLGAAAAGGLLDPRDLRPGTVVVDDSFPRLFADADAKARMTGDRDVLLVGGGMLDVGELRHVSPLPGANRMRARLPSRWLPGCHAEAVLLAALPELGVTRGTVTVGRAERLLEAIESLGWRTPPLHLGTWEIPAEIVAAVGRCARSRR